MWVGLGAVAGVVLLVRVAPDLVGLVVLGAALAYLLVPLVDRLERRGMGRASGAALVLGGLVLGLAGTAYAAAPTVAAQVASLRARWASGELLGLLRRAEEALAAHLGGLRPDELGLSDALQDLFSTDTGPLIGYVPSLLEGVSNAVVVPFVLFTLLKDGPVLRRRIVALVPNRYFEFSMNVLYKADAHLGGYLRGQALVAVLVGASTALGLGVLGVDYYLVLGLVTGLANVVPYAGFVVSAGLAVVVSVVTTGDVQQVVGVLAVFGVLQTVENVVFQPVVTGRTVSMDPALVLLAILVGGRVGGVLGMALGVPIAAILKVVAVETVTGLRRYHL
ncbi:MAG TPA: AI-2E family transporter [Rubricoccaceae bacterium]